MPRFRVENHCNGVRAADGTVYDCKPGGVVEIENPRHLKWLKESGILSDGDAIEQRVRIGNPAGVAQKICPACTHDNWPWAMICCKCKGEFK